MDGLLRIGAFSQQVGMQPTTVRAWERRYGLPVTRRTPGGQRLYDADCVRQLEQARTLVAQGWSLHRAARRVAEEAERRRSAAEVGTDQLVKALLVADERADLAGLRATADEALSVLARRELLDAVLAPVIAAGPGRLLEDELATVLAGPLRSAPAPDDAPLALVAAPAPGRTGSVAALRLALAGAGWRTASVGDGVGVEDVLHVVERTGAALVALAVAGGDGPGWARLAAGLRSQPERLGRSALVVAGAPEPVGEAWLDELLHRGALHRLALRAVVPA